MSAKAYDKLTAAFAGFMIQNAPSDLGESQMKDWMNNPNSMKRFMYGLRSREQVDLKLICLATVDLEAVGSKKTKACFTKDPWGYREDTIDEWFPKEQPSADACSVSTLAVSRETTIVECLAAALGVAPTMSLSGIGQLLVKGGHTMTLTQIESMVGLTYRGEKDATNTEMRTDGWCNYFAVETGNPGIPVALVAVSYVENTWGAELQPLTLPHLQGEDGEFYKGGRLLLRNW